MACTASQLWNFSTIIDVFNLRPYIKCITQIHPAILLLDMHSFGQRIARLIFVSASLSWCMLSWAQDSTEVPDPPSIPTQEERSRAEQAAKYEGTPGGSTTVGADRSAVQTSETVVGSSTVTEFSRGGHVFMLRVKPKNAPAQYIDESLPGGRLIPNDPGISEDTQTNLPKWRLGSF